jgi:DNA repair exonuclease SbcCD ATPase subunit
MSVANNEELVKRIARLAKQNQELEEHIKKLEKMNEELIRDNNKIKVLYERMVKAKRERGRLNSIWRQFCSQIFMDFHGWLKEWIHHQSWMNLMR